MHLRTISAIPGLSVVVVVLAGRAYLLRCLQALKDQVGVSDAEILVPCDDRVPDIPTLEAQFPPVRFLPIKGRRTCAELRAIGVQEAQGAIVALTEDHCTPTPDWCAQILKAHRMPHAAIGGAVEKELPDTALNWAMYLADYARYMGPALEGLTNHLTDCNVSYKRSALEAIANVWRDEFHEPTVHGALQAHGESLWFSPRIIVHQRRSLRLGATIRDRYIFGRLFGSGRVTVATTPRRLIYAGLAILLPPLLIGRVASHVIRKRRCVGAFLRALPILVLLSSVWALGECVGYLTGQSDASLAPGGQGGPGAQGAREATA